MPNIYILIWRCILFGQMPENTKTIDEIKGVYKKVEEMEAPIFVHKAQAMVYAYIYAEEHQLQNITVQMTYCNLETEIIKRFQEQFTY